MKTTGSLPRRYYLFLCGVFLCVFTGNTATAASFANKTTISALSAIDTSCEMFAKKYNADSTDYRALFSVAACTQSSSSALELYKQIAATDSAGDSLRAASFLCIGYYYVLKEDYAYARENFAEACRFVPTQECAIAIRNCDTKRQAEKLKNSSDAVNDFQSSYTLQIGSFSNVENANARALVIQRIFVDVDQNVEVVKSVVGCKVFFRVRVGTFPSPAEALAFGEKYLKNRNIIFTVVRD